MTLPISVCLFARAARDKAAYLSLRGQLNVNLEHGAFTLVPCKHMPRCALTEKETDVLIRRLEAWMEAKK